MPRNPLLNEVPHALGDTVYWDDRDGWRGKIAAIHEDGTLDVEYDNGESDSRIETYLFTKEA